MRNHRSRRMRLATYACGNRSMQSVAAGRCAGCTSVPGFQQEPEPNGGGYMEKIADGEETESVIEQRGRWESPVRRPDRAHWALLDGSAAVGTCAPVCLSWGAQPLNSALPALLGG